MHWMMGRLEPKWKSTGPAVGIKLKSLKVRSCVHDSSSHRYQTGVEYLVSGPESLNQAFLMAPFQEKLTVIRSVEGCREKPCSEFYLSIIS